MSQFQNSKRENKFDLEDRTYYFAKNIRDYVKNCLKKSVSNLEYGKQLIRSSGSVASNYIEANECLSKKDFVMRIKICRKEAKESRLWIRLSESRPESEKKKKDLIDEAEQLMKIFGAVLEKCK